MVGEAKRIPGTLSVAREQGCQQEIGEREQSPRVSAVVGRGTNEPKSRNTHKSMGVSKRGGSHKVQCRWPKHLLIEHECISQKFTRLEPF